MQCTVINVTVCAFLVQCAFGANLRHGRLAVQSRLARKHCTKLAITNSFLETDNALVPTGAAGSGLGARGGVVADGYSRIGCDVDIAPASQKISFKEHACGDGLKSCRLTELGMTPRLCFDFCRQYENAKFFGLRAGRECHCGVYFHARSVGGEGECNAVCEGDAKEMCGGMEKSSLFEMHMCADSASEAQQAADMSKEAVKASDEEIAAGKAVVSKLSSLVGGWKLDVCSLAPEGQRVCELPQMWTGIANKITSASTPLGYDTNVLTTQTASLASATTALAAMGKSPNSTMMSSVEFLTSEVRTAAAKVQGDVEMMKSVMKAINGPLVGSPLKSFEVFKPLGDVNASWYAVCALVAIPGESYAAVTKDDPATCASRCLSLSTGTEACAAFNYQYKDGLATCQLLTANGVVEPKDSLNFAVPIFEISKTKRDSMGISSMGCYAHGAFTAGHPRGPLGTKVIKEVIVQS